MMDDQGFGGDFGGGLFGQGIDPEVAAALDPEELAEL